jgi:hypothetical protein
MTTEPQEDDDKMNTVNLNIQKHQQNGSNNTTVAHASAKGSAERLAEERVKNHKAALESITSEFSVLSNNQLIEERIVIGFINNALSMHAIETNVMENPWLYPQGKTFLGDVDTYNNGFVLCDIVTGPLAGNLLDITDRSSIKIITRNKGNGHSII